MSRRVVVTGLGMTTGLGLGWRINWERLVAGASAIDRISSVDVSTLPVKFAAEVREMDPLEYVQNKKVLKMVHRNVVFGLAAAKEAVEDACLDFEGIPPERVGVYIGSGEPGSPASDFSEAIGVALDGAGDIDYEKFGEAGIWRLDPYFLLKMLPNNLACYVSMQYNARGPNSNIVFSGVAGAQAIGEGFKAIQQGYADVVIAGGYDSFLEKGVLQKYGEMGLFCTKTGATGADFCPFDGRRDGFFPGEGAGIAILEALSHAEQREAPIHAEMVGYGCACDAYHIIDLPRDGKGTALAIQAALQDGDIPEKRVDYICAHGNGTVKGDLTETVAIKSVFGKTAYDVPVSSIKPMTGHLGAASGAVEFIATVLATEKGTIPPTINYRKPDPKCDLDYVPNSARQGEVDAAICLNRGIGGQNTALVVKRTA